MDINYLSLFLNFFYILIFLLDKVNPVVKLNNILNSLSVNFKKIFYEDF